MSIYLDYNASAPIDPRVLDVIIATYKKSYGNADSRTHDFGDRARKIVEEARSNVASLLGVNKDEVFFTSGATESNNISILGLREYGAKVNRRHIIVSSIEHKSVLEAAKSLIPYGFSVEFVSPDISGRINVDELTKKIREDTLLVSVMHVNNETGIIQPVKEIGEYLADKKIFFHIDATQSCGKLVDELRNINYDMLSMSAHKLSGPQGIGALILRKKAYRLPPIKPIMFGGSQEHGIRPGTIPVALVAGLGKACYIAEQKYEDNSKKCNKIKAEIIKLLEDAKIEYKINGNPDYCIFNTLNFSILGVSSEALMLSTKQYCGVSNGSACTSHHYTPSYVLTAMGIPVDQIESSVRISWGPDIDVVALITEFSNMLNVAKALKL